MAIEKDLIIKYRIDRTQAKREIQAHEQESKRALKGVADSAKQTESATSSAMNALASMVPTITAVGAASTVFSAVRAGVDETAAKVKSLTEDFLKQRDALRELAGILNVKGDINFTQQQYGFGAKVGMDVGEAGNFRAAFQGEAQQYKDKFKDPAEFAKFEEQLARFATANKINPDVAARLGGAVVRTMGKDVTSSQAMLTLGQSFGTMQQGSGDNNTLATNLTEAAGSMVGPGNAFKNLQEAAVATRVMAEANPAESFTMNQAMRTGLLQLKPGEQRELGVDAKMGNLDAIRAVAESSKKALAGGQTLDQFLMKFFPDVRSRRAFAIAISKGVEGDVIGKGMADVNGIGEGDTEGKVDATFADPSQAPMLRQAEAERKAEEAKFAHDRALVSPFLERARAQMAGQNLSQFQVTGRRINDAVQSLPRYLSGVDTNTQQQEEYLGAANQISRRAREAGVEFEGFSPSDLNTPSRTLDAKLAHLVELTEKANAQRDRQGGHVPNVINGKPNVGFPR